MKINRVTLTGADNSVEPNELLEISKKYPYVEWGILLADFFNDDSGGVARYPSISWLQQLIAVTGTHKDGLRMKVAGHIQGRWLHQLLSGKMPGFARVRNAHSNLYDLWTILDRLQLNFHSEDVKARADFNLIDFSLQIVAFSESHTILQMDGVNDSLFADLEAVIRTPVTVLFDTSAGAGIVPEEWPKPIPEIYCGYAGGLGPDNLVSELEKIAKVVDGSGHTKPIWIDMETKIRSDDGQSFDLDKCRNVLELVKPYLHDRFQSASV